MSAETLRCLLQLVGWGRGHPNQRKRGRSQKRGPSSGGLPMGPQLPPYERNTGPCRTMLPETPKSPKTTDAGFLRLLLLVDS